MLPGYLPDDHPVVFSSALPLQRCPLVPSTMADPSGSHSSVKLSVSRLFLEGLMGSEEPLDRYTAGIELSNACRRFYVSRLAAAERAKHRLGLQVTACTSVDSDGERDPPPSPPVEVRIRGPESDTNSYVAVEAIVSNGLPSQTSTEVNGLPSQTSTEVKLGLTSSSQSTKAEISLQKSMDVLKSEMASLIDQDLALMRQLLTLNEQIEELKWQRKLCGYSRGSLESSCTIDASLATLSDTDGDNSRQDLRDFPSKYPSPSSLSLFREQLMDRDRSSSGSLNKLYSSTGLRHVRTESPLTLSQGRRSDTMGSDASSSSADSTKKTQGDQHSFDSGIHEPECVPLEVLL